jgi:hypothetical protein
VLEVAGDAAKDFNLKRITPRHICLGIRLDEELDSFFKAVIAGGWVVGQGMVGGGDGEGSETTKGDG